MVKAIRVRMAWNALVDVAVCSCRRPELEILSRCGFGSFSYGVCMQTMAKTSGVLAALAAAVLFGISTPLAKLLVGQMDAWLLAGLLYLGSGVGMTVLVGLRRWWNGAVSGEARLTRAHLPWLAQRWLVAWWLPCCWRWD